jgi:hypothetical protein
MPEEEQGPPISYCTALRIISNYKANLMDNICAKIQRRWTLHLPDNS